MLTKSLQFTLAMVTIMATTNVAPGQSQTPVDPTLAALQLQQQQLAAQQAQMDARLKMQQDQQSMLTGALPTSTATPNSGAFSVSGTNPFPSQRLAYESLDKLAQQVAGRLTKTGTDKKTDLIAGDVLIYDQTEINSLVNYKALLKVLGTLQTQVTSLQAEFNNNLDKEAKRLLKLSPSAPPPPTTASKDIAGVLLPGLALGGLKTLSDLIGMFRTNTTIAYSSFTADDVALAAAVMDQLRAASKTVMQPAVMPLDVTDDKSAFMDQLSAVQTTLIKLQDGAGVDQALVQQLSDALNAFVQADQAVKANADASKAAGLAATRDAAHQYAIGILGALAGATLDVNNAGILKAQCDQFVKSIAGLVTAVTAAGTAFGTVQTALTAVANTGSATLTSILRAEKLMEAAQKPNTSILSVKTSVLGGSVVTRTNLFKGGTLLFTGGAIASFTLFDAKTGSVKASGLVVEDSKPQKQSFK